MGRSYYRSSYGYSGDNIDERYDSYSMYDSDIAYDEDGYDDGYLNGLYDDESYNDGSVSDDRYKPVVYEEENGTHLHPNSEGDNVEYECTKYKYTRHEYTVYKYTKYRH